MNIFTNLFPKNLSRLLAITAFSVSTLAFNSCKKTEEVAVQATVLSVVNTSPTLGTYNVYLNDTKINPAALPFGGRTAYAQYTAGDFSIKVTTANAVDNLLSKTITLADQTAYSYYLIGKTPNLDGLLVTDDLSTYSADKAFVRFINLSPDAPTLDLFVKDATTSLIADKAYKAVSGFVAVDPAVYNYDIKEKTTGTVKASVSTGAALVAGKYYTIIARGLVTAGDTDQGFSGQVLINN